MVTGVNTEGMNIKTCGYKALRKLLHGAEKNPQVGEKKTANREPLDDS
jgi:hypothetical protein